KFVAALKRLGDPQRVAEDANWLKVRNEALPAFEREQRAWVLEAPERLAGMPGQDLPSPVEVLLLPPHDGGGIVPRAATRREDVLLQMHDVEALAVAAAVEGRGLVHIPQEQALLLE